MAGALVDPGDPSLDPPQRATVWVVLTRHPFAAKWTFFMGEALTVIRGSRSDADLDQLLLRFCAKCSWWDNLCGMDKGCKRAPKAAAWRRKAKRISYQCALGKWPAAAEAPAQSDTRPQSSLSETSSQSQP